MGNGILTQLGGYIAYPFKNSLPTFPLVVSVLIIAITVWLLSDSVHWPEMELPKVEAI